MPLTRKRIRLLFASVAFLILLFFLYVFFGGNTFPDQTPRELYISRGNTFAGIVDSLESRGMIRSRPLFLMVARLLGGTDRIQVGKYLFRSGASNHEIFLTIRSGRASELILVTIPEGLRARAQARIFSRSLGVDPDRLTFLTRDRGFIASLEIADTTLEGYLLPDTYTFAWQQDEGEILRGMVAQFRKFYDSTLWERQERFGWTTSQVLTLASIVEGEAVRADERRTISGVYWNRLKRGMKLEADPTIQYILNGRPRRLAYADLKIAHPYNTYQRVGLPPGPVNNPGKASILAALYPEEHTYLFFVADGRGGHRFASTYGEHLRNVRAYRRARSRK